MKIVSWNVNGIQACRRKGFIKFLDKCNADIVCCQEVKSRCLLNTPGYQAYWNLSNRTNYSGTLVLTKKQPLSISDELEIPGFDDEGRFLSLEFKDYYVINVYVPNVNPNSPADRPDFRHEWDKALKNYLAKLSKPYILCGDMNVAREYIDVYPDNQRNSPEPSLFISDEREGFEELMKLGLVDVFRAFYPGKEGAYTWWGPKTNRIENKGSRLDYFLVSENLFEFIQDVKHYPEVMGSDHCPISLKIRNISTKKTVENETLATLWNTIDWAKMRVKLFEKQRQLAEAADMRNWSEVTRLQEEIVSSYEARVLAVKSVSDADSAAGIDGIRWKTPDELMSAVLSLSPRNYHPLPQRHFRIVAKNKPLDLLVPAAKDKAMLLLYVYALDPVAEALGDKKSFFSRKGRSTFDVNSYIVEAMQEEGDAGFAVNYAVIADVKAFFSNVIHKKLVERIPMDKTVLQKFLDCGVVKDGELFLPDKGISFASSLSPILGNMLLDGLQSYIYDNLYPHGGVNYANGNVIRFADDLCIFAKTRGDADRILNVVRKFLEERGLRLNQAKTHIANLAIGFDFLSRHYQRQNGIVKVCPSEGSMIEFEYQLKELIENYRGTQRGLIDKLNQKLSGRATYHLIGDAYDQFRHIDTLVNGLLLDRMRRKHPRWKQDTILRKYWIRDEGDYIFALPDEPTHRVIQLAPLPIVKHKPCRPDFNPYTDEEYALILQRKRDVQKIRGKYKSVWNRQNGKCAYCSLPMLPDQDVEVVEICMGMGKNVHNLQYIHASCAFGIFPEADFNGKEHLDLFAILSDLLDPAPIENSPYWELSEYFRKAKKPAFTLTFKQIESILGEQLPWEAYFFEAFWYDTESPHTSPFWSSEGFPFRTLKPTHSDFQISDAWTLQGFKIKGLYLGEERVVFRQEVKNTSGVTIPRAITQKRLPNELVYKLEKMLRKFVEDNGL